MANVHRAAALAALLLVAPVLTCGPPPQPFMWGIWALPFDGDLPLAEELGVSHVGVPLFWSYVDGILDNPGLALTEITPDLVADYAFNDPDKDWAWFDAILAEMEALGLEPVVAIGLPHSPWLPMFIAPDGSLKEAWPNEIGAEQYQANLYLFTRAAALRYSTQVEHWMIENEPNAAGPMTLIGWRKGNLWWDPGFVTSVVSTLNQAVKAGDPTSKTIVAFHTDLPGWTLYAHWWKPHYDILGVDTFPNYFFGWPVLGQTVKAKVAMARAIAPEKNPMVLSTGYPSTSALIGHTPERQAQYVAQAAKAAKQAGASGFFVFCLRAFVGGTAAPPASEFLQNPLSYVGSAMATVEPNFGLVDSNGTPKPAFAAYKAAIQSLGN